jgi:hypothetical protein
MKLVPLALLFAGALNIWAQGASSIRGVITAAAVTLKEKDNGISRAAVTSTVGEYQFRRLALRYSF